MTIYYFDTDTFHRINVSTLFFDIIFLISFSRGVTLGSKNDVDENDEENHFYGKINFSSRYDIFMIWHIVRKYFLFFSSFFLLWIHFYESLPHIFLTTFYSAEQRKNNEEYTEKNAEPISDIILLHIILQLGHV